MRHARSLALGATPLRTVVTAGAPGLLLAVVGVSIGLVAARLAARTLEHLVWGVTVGDPMTFAMAAGACSASRRSPRSCPRCASRG